MEIQPDSVFLRSCPLCDKVYTQEHSYSRHIKYCRRAQTKRKGRPKSCITCSKAKAKCSFAQPCSRCEKKGIECAYQSSHADSVSALQRPHQWPWAGDGNYQTNVDAYAELSGFLELPVELGDLASGSSIGQLPQASPLTADILGLTGVVAQSELELVNFGLADQQANPRRPYRNTNKEIIHLPYGAPNLHQAANLILQTLYAFPQMMLRRQTFPPFIHPHWHMPCLPETLANCMSIAQLFAARTPETRAFLWKTISAEEDRFRRELLDFSEREVQMAVQSMIIYMIMAVIDQDSQTRERGARLLDTVEILSARFLRFVGTYSRTEQEDPSPTWQDWIFAESRRRGACLWVIISCVLSIDDDIPCAGCSTLQDLPLPSNKMLWEARSSEEWQVERAFDGVSSPMTTLGELVLAKRDATDPLHAQRLQTWEVGSDKMAVMLNIATEFVWARMG
ncbi:hypothetical protein ACJZ2D_002031 [Fusarium nematophilum]